MQSRAPPTKSRAIRATLRDCPIKNAVLFQKNASISQANAPNACVSYYVYICVCMNATMCLGILIENAVLFQKNASISRANAPGICASYYVYIYIYACACVYIYICVCV